MPRLSIIIPALGNWEALEDTLVSVLQNRPPRSEVVVVHNRVYDDPYDLKDEVRFVEAPARSGLVDLINIGLQAARSELVHLLPCGAVVDEGWTTAAVRHFADSRIGAVAPVVLDGSHPARLLSAGCHWLRGGCEADYGPGRTLSELEASEPWTGPNNAVAFYRRSALSEVGSFDASLSPRFAAIDLSLRLIQAGHQTRLEPQSQVTVEPSLLKSDGAFRQAWQRERLFWRYARKQGWVRSVAAHGWLLITETLKNIPRPRSVAYLAGRLVGACDTRRSCMPVLEPLPREGSRAAGPAGLVERRVDQPHAKPASQSRGGTLPSRAVNEVRGQVR